MEKIEWFVSDVVSKTLFDVIPADVSKICWNEAYLKLVVRGLVAFCGDQE